MHVHILCLRVYSWWVHHMCVNCFSKLTGTNLSPKHFVLYIYMNNFWQWLGVEYFSWIVDQDYIIQYRCRLSCYISIYKFVRYNPYFHHICLFVCSYHCYCYHYRHIQLSMYVDLVLHNNVRFGHNDLKNSGFLNTYSINNIHNNVT